MLLSCDLSMNNLSLWIAVFNLMELVGVVCATWTWRLGLQRFSVSGETIDQMKVVFGCWNGNGNARKQDYAEMTMNWYLIALRLEPYWFCLCSILFRWRLVSRPLWSIAGQVMLHLREPNAGKCSHFEQPFGFAMDPSQRIVRRNRGRVNSQEDRTSECRTWAGQLQTDGIMVLFHRCQLLF